MLPGDPRGLFPHKDGQTSGCREARSVERHPHARSFRSLQTMPPILKGGCRYNALYYYRVGGTK